MATGYASGTNTFVPSFDATGQLTVAFSRNPKDFALNRYVTLTPVKKSTGYYLRITAEQAARVINSDYLREFVWHDGDDAPDGNWAAESFEFKTYHTERYAFPFRIGYKAEEQADWKIQAAYAEFAAQDAMTARSVKVLNKVTDTGNYEADKTSTATALVGGFLNTGSPTDPLLKEALNSMAFKIHKTTLGRVKPQDLVVVINPELADALARSQEVHAYLKESPFALAQIRGDSPNQNGMWGLPETIYGYKFVVEDCVRVTNKKGATKAAGYALSSNYLAMLARPGELTSIAGGPSFSSIHVFAYEEMTVESRDDVDNRRIHGRVVEDNGVEMVSPASSALITACLS
jgi:hypothetical protein